MRRPNWLNVLGLVNVPAVLTVACMAAPPDTGWGFVAAVADAAPSAAVAMSTDVPALQAIRRKSRYDNYYPFSFCAYGVSCRARAERVRYAGCPAIRPPEPCGSIGFPAPRGRGDRGLGWACMSARQPTPSARQMSQDCYRPPFDDRLAPPPRDREIASEALDAVLPNGYPWPA